MNAIVKERVDMCRYRLKRYNHRMRMLRNGSYRIYDSKGERCGDYDLSGLVNQLDTWDMYNR